MFKALAGMISVSMTGADVAGTLTHMSLAGVAISDLESVDDLTVCFRIRRTDLKTVYRIGEKRGDTLQVTGRFGVYWSAKEIVRRPVLLLGMAVLLILSIYVPGRVFFVCVKGNETIPSRRIIEQAEGCGVGFGASRKEIRSEQVKNRLLSAIPQLQWAGVNTRGCVAIISVTERSEARVDTPKTYAVSSLVAVRDGVILSCTATRGTPLCQVGQAVQAGQTLISGYTDCGISIRAEQAEGEVYAQTQRDLQVLAPMNYSSKGSVSHEEEKISLIIGKKRINLFKGSGILDASCDKMYAEYYLTLPGGFCLPVALSVETHIYYEKQSVSAAVEDIQIQSELFAQEYLKTQMVSGQIVSGVLTVEERQDILILFGRYVCREMIGRVHSEEIISNQWEK